MKERVTGMMKNRWLLLMACLILASLFIPGRTVVAAVSGTVVATENEFGGKTVEKVYDIKKIRNARIQKDITYFDKKGKKVKVESLYTEQHIISTGAERRIAYYDAKGELSRMEKFFVESYARLKGVDRIVVHYDLKKKSPRTEYYLGSKLVKKPK